MLSSFMVDVITSLYWWQSWIWRLIIGPIRLDSFLHSCWSSYERKFEVCSVRLQTEKNLVKFCSRNKFPQKLYPLSQDIYTWMNSSKRFPISENLSKVNKNTNTYKMKVQQVLERGRHLSCVTRRKRKSGAAAIYFMARTFELTAGMAGQWKDLKLFLAVHRQPYNSWCPPQRRR